MKLKDLLEICEFKDFPFDFKPLKAPGVWAGRKEILNELIHFKNNVVVDGLAEFGVVSGTHGAGKSHSLLHLRHLIDSSDEHCLSVYIDNPCGLGAKGTFVEDYMYILSTGIGSDEIRNIFSSSKELIFNLTSKRISSLSASEQRKITSDDAELNKIRERIYMEIVGNSPIPFKAFLRLADGDKIAWDWLSISDPKINRVGDATVQKLTSHIICAKALATIIKLATLRQDNENPNLYSAIFIFVDQAEDIATLPAGAFQEQIAGWRTLIDEIDSNFGLIWAMTGEAEDIYANFTDAIQRRQTIDSEKLRLLPLDNEESKQFIIEVMNQFRKTDAEIPNEKYPFTDDGLEEIVNQTVTKTPGHLLNTCRRIFTKIAENDDIQSKDDEINSETVLQYI